MPLLTVSDSASPVCWMFTFDLQTHYLYFVHIHKIYILVSINIHTYINRYECVHIMNVHFISFCCPPQQIKQNNSSYHQPFIRPFGYTPNHIKRTKRVRELSTIKRMLSQYVYLWCSRTPIKQAALLFKTLNSLI